jgi:hypothetical protein
VQNCHLIFFLRPDLAQAHRGGGGGPSGHGRRRSGHRGAELGHETDRGGEDELDGGLTSGGRRRLRPELKINRASSVRAPGAAALASGGAQRRRRLGGDLGQEAARLGLGSLIWGGHQSPRRSSTRRRRRRFGPWLADGPSRALGWARAAG